MQWGHNRLYPNLFTNKVIVSEIDPSQGVYYHCVSLKVDPISDAHRQDPKEKKTSLSCLILSSVPEDIWPFTVMPASSICHSYRIASW